MKIYYAHSRMKYNTMIEQYELALIRREFPDAEIINPNGMVDQNQSEEAAMKECIKLVDQCDILVFSSVDGVIGKGVYEEMKKARKIFYIERNAIIYKSRWRFASIYDDLSLTNTGITPDMIYAIAL